jgi:hypothetical protein
MDIPGAVEQHFDRSYFGGEFFNIQRFADVQLVASDRRPVTTQVATNGSLISVAQTVAPSPANASRGASDALAGCGDQCDLSRESSGHF